MQVPLDITFRNSEPSEAIRSEVERQAKRLEKFRPILMCGSANTTSRGPHQGRWCFGKTPMQTFLDAMPMIREKMIAA
jgi:hypothetical protein